MRTSALWLATLLLAGCGGEADPAVAGAMYPGDEARDGDSSTESPPPTEQEEPDAAAPTTEKEVVIALIEAFQAGDRDRVEELWARDGGTWTDDEQFHERATHYQQSEFDLEPGALRINTEHGIPQVIVEATRDGRRHIWAFFVQEVDGRMRAGGVMVRELGPVDGA